MSYTFCRVIVTRLFALQPPKDDFELSVVLEDIEATLRITSRPDDLLQHADRELALRNYSLDCTFGGHGVKSLVDAVDDVQRDRRAAIGADPVLVVELRGAAQLDLTRPHREESEFTFGVDVASKQHYRDRTDPLYYRIVAAMLAAARSLPRVNMVVDSVYFVRHDGHPCYVANPGVTANAHVRESWTPKDYQNFASLLTKSLAVPEFGRTLRLYALSASDTTDPLRRFLRAWTAIETLVLSFFKRTLEVRLGDPDAPESVKRLKQEILKRERKEYTLRDQFAVVGAYLCPGSAESDIRVFKELKAIRDKVSHGEAIADQDLPGPGAEHLMQVYLQAWHHWTKTH